MEQQAEGREDWNVSLHIDNMSAERLRSDLKMALTMVEQLRAQVAAHPAAILLAKAEVIRDVLTSYPGCVREGLCRENWTGELAMDDCSVCASRQRLKHQEAHYRAEAEKAKGESK